MNERIRVGAQPIADDDLAHAIERVLEVRDAAEADESAASDATWFDLVTAGALDHFARAGVPWVVLEVGLGGRLDSTNVVTPVVSVVTNIDLEHTDVLGDTRAEIAAEKGGILKPGVPFVCGVDPPESSDPTDDARGVLLRRAAELSCPVLFPEAGRVDPGAQHRARSLRPRGLGSRRVRGCGRGALGSLELEHGGDRRRAAPRPPGALPVAGSAGRARRRPCRFLAGRGPRRPGWTALRSGHRRSCPGSRKGGRGDPQGPCGACR